MVIPTLASYAQVPLTHHDINGHNVFLIPTEAGEEFHFRALVPVGGMHGLAGQAHFAEHLMFSGTTADPRLQPHSMGEALDLLGEANAFTATQYTAFEFSGPSKHFLEALTYWGNALVRPSFPLKAIHSEGLIIQNEQFHAFNEHAHFEDLFSKHIYGSNHPLGYPIIGTPETRSVMDQASFFSFHRAAYESLAIIVAGPMDQEGSLTQSQILAQLASYFPRRAKETPKTFQSPRSMRPSSRVSELGKTSALEFTVKPGRLPSLTLLFLRDLIKDHLAVDILMLDMLIDRGPSSLARRLYDLGAVYFSVDEAGSIDTKEALRLEISYPPGTDPYLLIDAVKRYAKHIKTESMHAETLNTHKSIFLNQRHNTDLKSPAEAIEAFEESLLVIRDYKKTVQAWLDYDTQIQRVDQRRLQAAAKSVLDFQNVHVAFKKPVEDLSHEVFSSRTIPLPDSIRQELDADGLSDKTEIQAISHFELTRTHTPPHNPQRLSFLKDDPRFVALLNQHDTHNGELGIVVKLIFGELKLKDALALSAFRQAMEDKFAGEIRVFSSVLRDFNVFVDETGLGIELCGDPDSVLSTLDHVLSMFKTTNLTERDLGRTLAAMQNRSLTETGSSSGVAAEQTLLQLFLPFLHGHDERTNAIMTLTAREVQRVIRRLFARSDIQVSASGPIDDSDFKTSLANLATFSPRGLTNLERDKLDNPKIGGRRRSLGFLAKTPETFEASGADDQVAFGYARLMTLSVKPTLQTMYLAELTADFIDHEIFQYNRERKALGYVHGASIYHYAAKPGRFAISLFGESDQVKRAKLVPKGWDHVLSLTANEKWSSAKISKFIEKHMSIMQTLDESPLDIAYRRLDNALLYGVADLTEKKIAILSALTPSKLREGMAKVVKKFKIAAEVAVPIAGTENEAEKMLSSHCEIIMRGDMGSARKHLTGQ